MNEASPLLKESLLLPSQLAAFEQQMLQQSLSKNIMKIVMFFSTYLVLLLRERDKVRR